MNRPTMTILGLWPSFTDGSAGDERRRCGGEGDILILDGLDGVVGDEEAA